MEITFLIVFIILILLIIVFRKTLLIKKYWYIILIILPAFILISLKFLTIIFSKKPNTNFSSTDLKDQINSIKEKLNESNTIIKIEAISIKTKNEQMKKNLKEVQKIKNDKERQEKLAQMIG